MPTEIINAPPHQVKKALFELQRYLSDRVAPLMVADSVELLLKFPPHLAAGEIQAWVTAQFHGPAAAAPVSDYLFHALKKIHALGEFKLLPPDSLRKYFDELAELLLEFCPVEDRENLRIEIKSVGLAESIMTSPVEILHRQAPPVKPLASAMRRGAEAGGLAGGSEGLTRGLKRFSLLLERLERSPGPSLQVEGETPPEGGDLRRQLLTMAAVNSRSSAELDHSLERLRHLGMDTRPGEVIRALGRSLPGWSLVLPESTAGARASLPAPASVEAMHRMVSMVEDREEGAKRFHEMVQAAVEQFNDGALAQAVTMFDLADRIISEKEIDDRVVESVRKNGHRSLDPLFLRKYTEKPEKHALLRKVLDFFEALRTEGLLEDLNGEQKRDRRHLLLALLETHGAPARKAAFGRLENPQPVHDELTELYFQRNLLTLLRRIPRPAEEPLDREVELLTRLTGIGNPVMVLKEAIPALGQFKHARAEQVLINRLGEFEAALLAPAEGPYDTQDLLTLLDRTTATLARSGTLAACAAVVEHGLRKQPQLGWPLARLGDLGAQDLSSKKELVGRLVKALKAELPMKVLGLVLQKKKTDGVLHLIKALSGTPAPAVRNVFEEILHRFPGEEFTEAASRALAALGATSRPQETSVTILSGDLELFGLPNLLQNLADSRVTGVLALADPEGKPTGTIAFEAGKILNCQTGGLRGDEAIYQLFEKPEPGSFIMKNRREGTGDSEPAAQPRDVLPVVLEAMRRHDELQQARTLVPDEACLKPTGTRPSRPPDEADQNLLKSVWAKVCSGASAVQCEAEAAVDAYRARRLLAHWVEEGSLQIRQA